MDSFWLCRRDHVFLQGVTPFVRMADIDIHRLQEVIQSVEGNYHRLVLVVGPSGSGKTRALRGAANLSGNTVMNVNLLLSQRLLELSIKQRKLKVQESLSECLETVASPTFLDNTEVLFDVQLQQDPLRLLQGLSRNRVVVASWNGSFEGGRLRYADPSHPEHRIYEQIDAEVFAMGPEE